MTDDAYRESERERERQRNIQEICTRLPAELAELVGDALRSRRGVNFGSSDPEIVALIQELKTLTDQLDGLDR